jgi:co-chaperonin GroES (HSP10)
MKIIPKGPRVIVEQFDLEGASKAGVIILMGKGNYRLGKVLKVGDGMLRDGTCAVAPCAEGDLILYTKYMEFVLAEQTINMVTFDEVALEIEVDQ